MQPMINLSRYFQRLKGLGSGAPKARYNDFACSSGLFSALKSIFGNAAHVIDPELGLAAGLLSENERDAQAAEIKYAEQLSARSAGPELPIVMLLSAAPKQTEVDNNSQAINELHWVCCVILPKNYKPAHGQALGNAQEKVVLIDSFRELTQFPKHIKALLGVDHVPTTANKEQAQAIRPAFPNASVECYCPAQQAEIQDSGWWAVYNASMVVATGSTEYLKVFNSRDREFAWALRHMYPTLAWQEASQRKSIELFPYSSAMMRSILSGAGLLSYGPAKKMPKSMDDKFDIYISPYSTLTEDVFCKDQLDYLRVLDRPPKNRRVAFIFDGSGKFFILLLQLSDINVNLSGGLFGEENINKKLQVIRNLYRQINVMVFAEAGNADWIIRAFKPKLDAAYRGKFQIVFNKLNSEHKQIIVTDHVLSMLSYGGYQSVPDPNQLVLKHYKFCLAFARKILLSMQINDATTFKKVSKLMGILMKYSFLDSFISKLETEDMENLEESITNIKKYKCHIYSKKIHISESLSFISFKTLIQFSVKLVASNTVIADLEKERDRQLKLIKDREGALQDKLETLKSDWLLYLNYSTKKSAKRFYDASYISLAGNLSTLFFSTGDKKVNKVVKYFGHAVGGVATYFSGFYSVIRLALVLLAADATNNFYPDHVMNDKNAEVIFFNRDKFNRLGVIRLISLIVSAFEAGVTGDSRYLFMAASGLIGSVGAQKCVEKIMGVKPTSEKHANAKQVLLSLVVSLFGREVASSLSGLVFDVVNNVNSKILVREQVIQSILTGRYHSSNIKEVDVSHPALFNSPSLWFNSKNPIQISWTASQTVRSIDCDILDAPAGPVLDCSDLSSEASGFEVGLLNAP